SVANALRATLPEALLDRVTVWSPIGDARSYTVPPSGFRALFWMEATGTEDDFLQEDCGLLGMTDLAELPRRFIRLGSQTGGEPPRELLPGVLSTYRD